MMVLVLIFCFAYCITCSNNYYCIFHFTSLSLSRFNFVHNFAFHLPMFAMFVWRLWFILYCIFLFFSFEIKKKTAAVSKIVQNKFKVRYKLCLLPEPNEHPSKLLVCPSIGGTLLIRLAFRMFYNLKWGIVGAKNERCSRRAKKLAFHSLNVPVSFPY